MLMLLLDSNAILRYFTVSSSEINNIIISLYSFLWFRHFISVLQNGELWVWLMCEADNQRNSNNLLESASGTNTPRIVKFGFKDLF